MKGNFLYHLFFAARIFLYPFALLYGCIVWLRNRLYDSGVFSSVTFSVPVITVGNLSTGGTGKTPHIEYLVRLLQYRYKVATMSRGYKRHTQGFLLAGPDASAIRLGDEPMQFHLNFPDLVVSVAEDRMTGIPLLLQNRPDVEVVLLDDAYQHRSVKAGLSILITDYSKPYYTDHVLPFGSLREGRKAAGRADVIIVSKCPDSFDAVAARAMVAAIQPLPHQQVFFSRISYGTPYHIFTKSPAALSGKNVVLVAGIAKPQPMIDFVTRQAASVHPLTYADHHYFVSADMEEINDAVKNWDVAEKVIVTTEKDAARLLLQRKYLEEWEVQVLVLPIEIQFLFGQGDFFDGTVNSFVEKTIREERGEVDGYEETVITVE